METPRQRRALRHLGGGLPRVPEGGGGGGGEGAGEARREDFHKLTQLGNRAEAQARGEMNKNAAGKGFAHVTLPSKPSLQKYKDAGVIEKEHRKPAVDRPNTDLPTDNYLETNSNLAIADLSRVVTLNGGQPAVVLKKDEELTPQEMLSQANSAEKSALKKQEAEAHFGAAEGQQKRKVFVHSVFDPRNHEVMQEYHEGKRLPGDRAVKREGGN